MEVHSRIEKILEVKEVDGRKLYRVQWDGSSRESWEETEAVPPTLVEFFQTELQAGLDEKSEIAGKSFFDESIQPSLSSSEEPCSHPQDDHEMFGEYHPFGGVRGKSKKNKTKGMKMKGKSKKISSHFERNRRKLGVDKGNILSYRRPVKNICYKPEKQKFKEEVLVSKFNLRRHEHLIERGMTIEGMLVRRVIGTYQIGVAKHCRLLLFNNKEMLISMENMNRYFPNKLAAFYEQLIDSLDVSLLIKK